MQNERFIVGIGEILWDNFPTGKRLGGAPANFACHAGQFGHESLVVSAIGHDKDGADIIKELESHHLAYHLDRVSYKTGTVNVDLTDPNAPKYTIIRPVAWDHIPFTDDVKAIAAGAKAVCFGTLSQRGLESRRTIRLFLDSTPADCLKICDINLRQTFFNKSIIQESLRRADILKLNEEELPAITRLLGYQIAGEEVLCRRLMRAYKLQMIILTKGVHGSWVLWKGGKSFQGTPKVKVKSAVGAGDSFTGAFIGSLLNGKSIEEAHQVAVKLSAYVCTREGAMPVIPEEFIMQVLLPFRMQ